MSLVEKNVMEKGMDKLDDIRKNIQEEISTVYRKGYGTGYDDGYDSGYETGTEDMYEACRENMEDEPNEALGGVVVGMIAAWGAARDVAVMSDDEQKKLFGIKGTKNILKKFKPEDVIDILMNTQNKETKDLEHDQCFGCNFEEVDVNDFPCNSCSVSYSNHWTPDDRG